MSLAIYPNTTKYLALLAWFLLGNSPLCFGVSDLSLDKLDLQLRHSPGFTPGSTNAKLIC